MRTFLQQQNIRTLLLVTSTVIYMLLGAAVFSALEYDEHVDQKKKYKDIYSRLMKKYNMSNYDMEALTTYLHKRRHFDSLDPWNFQGSVYFTSVTITTIGYGHSVPQTIYGQVFCMIYAFIGIPLNVTMFQAIGERMGVLLSYLLRRTKRCMGIKNTEVNIVHLVAFGLLIWFSFLCGGAALFSHYETWTFFRSLYYFFTTLTTIGFGDLVALQQLNKNDPSNNALESKDLYVALTLILIYIGLTLASSVINLLVMRLMELQQPKRKRRTISLRNSSRCQQCKLHKNADGLCTLEDVNQKEGIMSNNSIIILKDIEEELEFKSYKQMHDSES